GPPRRGRAAHTRGGHLPGGGRHLGRPSGGPARELRGLRPASGATRGDRQVVPGRREGLCDAGRTRGPRHGRAVGRGRRRRPGDGPRDREEGRGGVAVPRPDQGRGAQGAAFGGVRSLTSFGWMTAGGPPLRRASPFTIERTWRTGCSRPSLPRSRSTT